MCGIVLVFLPAKCPRVKTIYIYTSGEVNSSPVTAALNFTIEQPSFEDMVPKRLNRPTLVPAGRGVSLTSMFTVP